eukprot:gene2360-2591_t
MNGHHRLSSTSSSYLSLQMSMSPTSPTTTTTATTTELPLDFFDAIERAANLTKACFDRGIDLVRIDFDTVVDDNTYSSLQNALPMAKEYVKVLSYRLGLISDRFVQIPEPSEDDLIDNSNNNNNKGAEEEGEAKDNNDGDDMSTQAQPVLPSDPPSITLFFPDMGSSALARRDWKLTTTYTVLPSCVTLAAMQRDSITSSTRYVILLCPQYSEVEAVERLVGNCREQDVKVIMINPSLVNADQGFGLRAKNIRRALVEPFVTAYKLKTLSEGAIVREWPQAFSLYIEDDQVDGGYRLLQNFDSDPYMEQISNSFMADENLRNPNSGKQQDSNGVLREVMGFFKGLSRL